MSYVFLPGILPRVQEFFGSGTGSLAFLIASIFESARLLPRSHPYLNSANINSYGIRDVFAAAANNLIFDRKHADQIVIFVTLMLGVLLFVLQFIILGGSFLIHQAHAAGMFTTTNNTTDIAFELLDRVFGVPDVYDSCVAQNIACGNQPALPAFPTPFNTALQDLFQYYSLGLLVVGVLIFVYYVFVVIAETAQTGTPFGRRFAHIWAPIRLVVAIGLLIPVSYGFNTGQFIVLYAAKMGSSFATNGWDTYTAGLTNGLGMDNSTFYAKPNVPDTWPLTKFLFLARTCADAYASQGVKDIKAYVIKDPGLNNEADGGYDYEHALSFYNNGDVLIRFGIKGTGDDFDKEVGHVKPYCGEIVVPTTATLSSIAPPTAPADYLIGPYQVQTHYYYLIRDGWTSGDAHDFSNIINYQAGAVPDKAKCLVMFPGMNCDTGVTTDFLLTVRNNTQSTHEAIVSLARTNMIAATDLSIPADILKRGWAGAGIWYNKMAEINGAFFSAVNFIPTPSRLPRPMQLVVDSKKGKDQNMDSDGCSQFNPNQSDGKKVDTTSATDKKVALVLYTAMTVLCHDDALQSSDVIKKDNIFYSTINLLFGTTGIFTMRNNTDVHPLAQLVGLGKGIIDATIRNLFTATIFSVGGGFFSAMPGGAGVGQFLNMAAGIMTSIATISLTAGFILYYVLPFLPFMYFFFAVGSWVKTIFEAMVGVPLWALGHLRIDGHGLPGENALSGYYMILEIFLRPILTIFGLVGALITFTALAKVLNQIFDIVTDNLSGFGSTYMLTAPAATAADMLQYKRNIIDQFFFTIIYTIIVYMMATSSFKLIDQIPAKILRWLGAGVSVFADQIDDPERGMTAYIGYSAASMTNQLGQAIQGAGGTLGQGLASALNKKPEPPAPGAKASQGKAP